MSKPVALATSSCASSRDLPVPIDWAAAAGKPAASSSVNETWNTLSNPPKTSTRRLARVGPSPGVRARAIQGICFELSALGGGAVAVLVDKVRLQFGG